MTQLVLTIENFQVRCLAYLATSRLPVRRRSVVLVGARFPISILPRVITELGRVLQLLFGDVGSKTTKRRIKCQSAPGDGIVAVAQPNKSAKAHDGIGHEAGHIVDD